MKEITRELGKAKKARYGVKEKSVGGRVPRALLSAFLTLASEESRVSQ